MLRFSGVKAGEACTIVLRGSSGHLLDEAERSLHDALAVLTETMKETRISFGGGCSEVRVPAHVITAALPCRAAKYTANTYIAALMRSCPFVVQMLMANVVDEEARKTPGKRQLAMEGYARALRQLPTIIADNAGYDSAELIAKVRAAHAAGDLRAGLDVRSGTVGNMLEMGITEPLKLKRQVLLSAAEAAEMILRVDDIIKCAPRKRDDDRES